MANGLIALPAIIAALGGPTKGGRRYVAPGGGPNFAKYNQQLLIEAGATFNKDERYWELNKKKLSEEAATFNGPEAIRDFISRAKSPSW